MKKFLLLFIALLCLGLNTQATEVTETSSPVNLAVTTTTQWDASAILTAATGADESGNTTYSGTITVKAEPNTDVTFTDNATQGEKSTEVTADGTGIATLDLADSDASALNGADKLYVIGENITSVVYQSIPDAPVAVEVTEGSQYVYFMDITGCWNSTDGAFADNVSFEIILDCSAANSGGQVGVNYNNWGSWTNAQFSDLDQNATSDGSVYTYSFTGAEIATALTTDVTSSIDKIYFEAYNGAIVKSATYTPSGEQAVELDAVKACEVRCTDVVDYPDETITISYTGSDEIWPDIQLVYADNSQYNETWQKDTGTYPSTKQGQNIELTINEMKTGSWIYAGTGAATGVTMFYFYVEIPVEETISMTYGTNITLSADDSVALDGTAEFTTDAILAFNSEGVADPEYGEPDANGIATKSVVETTFTLTLTPLTGAGNKVMLYANEDTDGVEATANTDGKYEYTATEILALLNASINITAVRPFAAQELTLADITSLTISGISSCSYTVTTKTTTTAYAPADATYSLDLPALKTAIIANNSDVTESTDFSTAVTITSSDITGNNSWWTDKTSSGIAYREQTEALIEVKGNSTNGGAISFEMEKAGTVTVVLSSNKTGNVCTFALYDDTNEAYLEMDEDYADTFMTGDLMMDKGSVAKNAGEGIVCATGVYATNVQNDAETGALVQQTAVWNIESAGTYTFCTNLAGVGRVTQIYALSVYEPGAGWEDATVTDFELTADEIAQLATDGTSTTVTATDEAPLYDADGNNVYKIDTEYTATLIVSIPADSQGVTFTANSTYTTATVAGTEIAGTDILKAIQAVEGASSITYDDLSSLTLKGAYAYSIVAEEKVTYTYYTTTETVDGYLTVTLAGATVGDANQEAQVTITTNEVTGEVTMAIASITVTGNISLSDVAITFTPGQDGTFENAAVTMGESSLGTASGSYVIDDEGNITFSADFKYMTIFSIGVSFTTVAPVVSDGWTVIATEADFNSDNCIVLDPSDLEGYTYIALDVTVDLEAGYSNFGALLTDGTWNGKYTNSDYDQDSDGNFDNFEGAETVYLVFSVEDLTEACSGIETIPFAFYGNVLSVSVYASADYEGEVGTFYPTTEAGEETPEPSTLYTFTGSVTITLATDPTSNNLGYGEVNQYNATSLLQLINIDGFGSGDFEGLTEDDIVTVTVTIDFSNCTATNYEGLKVALQGFDTSWGGWSSVDAPAAEASTVELTVSATIGQLMAVNNITDYTDFGGFALQIWNLSADAGLSSDYVGAVVTYTLTIREGAEDAIANIKSDVEVVEVARYNLMGQKLSGAEKGINIILYSDGSAKKVLVK